MAPSEATIVALHYLYPTTIFVYFVVTSLAAVFTLQDLGTSKGTRAKLPGRWTTIGLLAVFVSAHLAQLIVTVVKAAAGTGRPPRDDLVVGQLSCILVFGLQLSRLYDSPQPLWYPYVGSWAMALPFEVVDGASTWLSSSRTASVEFLLVNVILVLLRCVLLAVLLGLFCFRCIRRTSLILDEEEQSLLSNTKPPGNNESVSQRQNGYSSYGSTSNSGDDSDDRPETSWDRRRRKAREAMEKRLEAGGNWLNYAKDFMVCFAELPYRARLCREAPLILPLTTCTFAVLARSTNDY
jgi:hypothetical protein